VSLWKNPHIATSVFAGEKLHKGEGVLPQAVGSDPFMAAIIACDSGGTKGL